MKKVTTNSKIQFTDFDLNFSNLHSSLGGGGKGWGGNFLPSKKTHSVKGRGGPGYIVGLKKKNKID